MTYYEILGVARTAEADVIDAAYRAMMRRYHPDRFKGANEEAERRSKEINEAYTVLRDPGARSAYDATLAPEPAASSFAAPPRQLPGATPRPRRLAFVMALALPAVIVTAAYIFARPEAKPIASAATPPAARPVAPSVPSPMAAKNVAPPADVAKCRGTSCHVLTPFGWAGIETGVSTGSAQLASGLKIRDDGHYTDAGEGSCLSYEVVGGPKNLGMLVEQGNVTTVEVYRHKGMPNFETDRGVRLGDRESAVRAKYSSLKQLPNIYTSPPDKMLFYYEPGGERGIKFAIVKGIVESISVGTTSIEYVEGCL